MLVIIQARMSSKRLPGKVLRPLAGRPMLAWLIERVNQARLADGLMVATSREADDDAIHSFCVRSGIACYRGPLHDVAERMAAAADSVGARAFVRISGDSPLMSPEVVDAVIDMYRSSDIDLATNVLVRTFPKGFSVEAIRVAALRRSQTMMEPGEAEHVTSVFYRRPTDFRIVNISSGGDWGALQMSVDTMADFVLAERMVERSNGLASVRSLRELLALRESCLEGAA